MERARGGPGHGGQPRHAPPLLSLFVISLMACGALHFAGEAASPELPLAPFLAVVAAASPEAYGAYAAHEAPMRPALSLLDLPASVAMALLAYLPCAAAARAASPRGGALVAGALHAAASPVYAWFAACGRAVDAICGEGRARAAALAAALGAHVAYAMAHAAYPLVPGAHHPDLHAAMLAALAPAAADAARAWAHDGLLAALDAQPRLAMLASLPLLAEAACRLRLRRRRQ